MFEITDAVLRADLTFSGGPITYGDSGAAQVAGTLKASKQMPPANERKMYYADLRSQIHVACGDPLELTTAVQWVLVDGKTYAKGN